MTFKENLIENLKDHYKELFETELRKFSVEEQKDILQYQHDIQQILIKETKKGEHNAVIWFAKENKHIVEIICMWLDSELLFWEIEDKEVVIKLSITVA